MIIPALSFLVFALTFVMDHTTAAEEPYSSDNPLSSHVLDTSIGLPVPGIQVVLYKQEEGEWRKIAEQLTNEDGRVGELISPEEFNPAVYKLHFDKLSYYQGREEKTFYPFIEVVFQVEQPEEHYHVHILLSAYGFATYRGS